MKATDRVMQSYGRCCASPTFFDDFYQQFLASSPKIREKFTGTDMPAQKQLLRQGILNLVMFARGMPDGKLRALGNSHSRKGFDIRPNSTTSGPRRCSRRSAGTTSSSPSRCAATGARC